ncbi:hypothetical protein NPIL_672101 [Nephila pilipes]|uniref:Uncharacterized protein n=1 Tax=Nephila pilipes TaxID=299642 RepID=A0A8X6TP45_NEPPI|nr:hypothetical protein NPIL_672101 [Nephila pilipes]
MQTQMEYDAIMFKITSAIEIKGLDYVSNSESSSPSFRDTFNGVLLRDNLDPLDVLLATTQCLVVLQHSRLLARLSKALTKKTGQILDKIPKHWELESPRHSCSTALFDTERNILKSDDKPPKLHSLLLLVPPT